MGNDKPTLQTISQHHQPELETQQDQIPRFHWNLNLSTVVSSTTSAGSFSDTLGVVEFDPSGNLLATGGISRKIRIYNLHSLLPNETINTNSNELNCATVALLDHVTACDYYICTPAKLSSLKWKPGSAGRVIGSGDYDGVVMEYDLERRNPIFERDEHGGRRIWSIDYSHWDPVVGASGSDDGTMQMWDPRCDGGRCVAAVQPTPSGNPVCCVEFDPFGSPVIAVGCADRKAYGYDVRRIKDPVLVLDGHQKTVAYVRFVDHHTIVTSSTDGCLKMWDTDDQRLIRTYRGHRNNKRFTGLSVLRKGGLFGCGSEDNRVFVYDKRWGEAVWMHGLEQVGEDGFVSSVCWSQVGEEDQCKLVAGGSNGVLQVFIGKRNS